MSAPSVTLITHDLKGGGTQRVMVLLASGMAERGVDVELISIKGCDESVSGLSPAVKLRPLNASRCMKGMMPLIKHLRAVRSDVILSAPAHVNLMSVVARRVARCRIPLLVAEHSCPSYASRHGARWHVRIAHTLARYLYRYAGAVVAVSNGVAEELASRCGLDRQRLHCIYNPVLPGDFDELANRAVDHPWVTSMDKPIVLAVGRLEKVKNFTMLFQAFALLREQCDARLVVLGEGRERYHLTETAEALGFSSDLYMPGYLSNPYPWMRSASVLALTSESESFGNVLIEAMACRTPVVTVDCPTGPREILEAGRYGRLVPVDDVAAFAGALYDAIRLPGDLEAARQRAMEFTVERSVDQYAQVMGLDAK